MAAPEQGADAAALGKVRVKVQAEFWIDPLEHVSLEERRAMLLASRRTELPGSFPMCGVDSALKQVNHRVLLEVFMSELACALRPLSTQGNQEQIVTESFPKYDIRNGQSSGGQIYDDTLADGRFVEIQNASFAINFEPVQMSSHMAVNIGDSCPLEDCRAEGSWSNICQDSCLGPCPGDRVSSRGQRDAGAACKDRVLSSLDDSMKVNIEPSEASVHRDACVPHERKINVPAESEKEHRDCTSLHEGHKLSLFSSIHGDCSRLDAPLESDHCYSPLAESSITTSHGRSSVCYPEEAYPEDLSSHSQDMSQHVSRYSDNDVRDHANKLNGHDNVGIEFPLGKSVNGSSVVNVAEHICTSTNDITASSIASFPCMGEECIVINSDRVSGAGATTAFAGRQAQSSSKANKQFSVSNLSTDPVRMKYKFGDEYNLPEESAAKHMHASISVFPGSCALKQVSEVLSGACMGNILCGISDLPEKGDQSPVVGQKETQCKTDCSLHDSSLPTSTAMVKVEPANEAADAQVSEENHEHGGICSQESFTNCLKAPLMAEQERNSGRVKLEPPEEILAVCSSEATTVSEFNTLAFNSSNTFIRDPSQATRSGTCNLQTIQEGLTVCSDKMAVSMPAGRNLRDVLPDSVLSALPEEAVKKETLEGIYIGNVSVREAAVNFSSSASESFDEAAGMSVCTGAPVGGEQETHCNMTDFLQDAVLSTFPMRVKDEPFEDYVIGDSEPICENDSGFSILHSPINAVVLNPLLDMPCSSKAINCQDDSISKIHNVRNDQETITSSSQLNISEDNGIITRQKEMSMANPYNSDVLASKGVKNVERMDKMCTNIFFRNATGVLNSSCSSNNLIPKVEPMEDAIKKLGSNSLGTFSISDTLLVEAKSEIVGDFSEDILDHLPLTERTKMLAFDTVSGLKPARKSRRFKHAVGCDSVDSIKHKAKSNTIRRKRKRTATDSVEVALEEDAPGLLQGLLDRGINLDEIKLYGCEEDIDALDISSSEDSFEDLEAVISKLFSERPTSLFKLAPVRHSKGTKAVYCLACLISLIEQTRYLQFRNHPVEWGWCRDLQSFIFVFKMHNRIVLERPEYGYATYFFELVESFPIDWQIKRLVTAMKLTSCSRATLIENKTLLVGVDLSEGEARVLEEYGWLPDTGLGSMLNYCDRVVHDRNDRDVSEWRSKIGKLLMDGYDGGCVVKVDLPKKVMDYVGGHFPEIKMET